VTSLDGGIRSMARTHELLSAAWWLLESNVRAVTVQTVDSTFLTRSCSSACRTALVNTYVAAVRSLSFAHRVGLTRFYARPLSKLKTEPRQIEQRIMSEVEVAVLIRAAKTDRDRLMFDLAYFGGLRGAALNCRQGR
jgi:integrase